MEDYVEDETENYVSLLGSYRRPGIPKPNSSPILVSRLLLGIVELANRNVGMRLCSWKISVSLYCLVLFLIYIYIYTVLFGEQLKPY